MGGLPDYSKITFPDTAGVAYTDMVPDATPGAVHLLSNLVLYNSANRLAASVALRHHYFYEQPFPARWGQYSTRANHHHYHFLQDGRDAATKLQAAGRTGQGIPNRPPYSPAL